MIGRRGSRGRRPSSYRAGSRALLSSHPKCGQLRPPSCTLPASPPQRRGASGGHAHSGRRLRGAWDGLLSTLLSTRDKLPGRRVWEGTADSSDGARAPCAGDSPPRACRASGPPAWSPAAPDLALLQASSALGRLRLSRSRGQLRPGLRPTSPPRTHVPAHGRSRPRRGPRPEDPESGQDTPEASQRRTRRAPGTCRHPLRPPPRCPAAAPASLRGGSGGVQPGVPGPPPRWPALTLRE